MKYDEPQASNQSGSAIFIILISIALFAALSFAVANMMRSGNAEKIGEQKAGILADEIIDYARTVKKAVQYVRISNGCEETEISFENDVVSGYTNPNSPSDNSCHIFNVDGADTKYRNPIEHFGIGTEWMFSGRLNIYDLGYDCLTGDHCAELVMILSGLNLSVCREINKKMNIVTVSGDPPRQSDVVFLTKFIGDYAREESIEDVVNDNVLRGEPSGCTEVSSGGSYFFYYVLLAR